MIVLLFYIGRICIKEVDFEFFYLLTTFTILSGLFLLKQRTG